MLLNGCGIRPLGDPATDRYFMLFAMPTSSSALKT